MTFLTNIHNLLFLLNGMKVTLIVAVLTIVLSLIFGTILALIKNDTKGPLSWLVSSYIEIFRCTPNILWVLIVFLMLSGSEIYKGILAFTLFTTSVVAEIIRGGLNSIPPGQFEAAHSQGFNYSQALFYIILPQTFKRIIPSLLSQIITIIKDTSYLYAAVAVQEFTGKAKILAGEATSTLEIFTIYAFIALVYFLINFTLSSIVRYYQNRTITI